LQIMVVSCMNTFDSARHSAPGASDSVMRDQLLARAFLLSLITIVYNVIEGMLSVYFGYSDDTLALFGFGVDSFVEVLSGIGIAHMIRRLRKHGVEQRDNFERTALRITGIAFYILAVGLLAGAVINIAVGTAPETTIPGIIISVASLATMYLLFRAKLNVGRALRSDAIIADANCTKTCYYLSLILLASSALYELFGFGWVDMLGSLGIAWFAWREGREAMTKARTGALACNCEH
jgi:divalent metal cation (Fe/Co/Zn/Cd) transporter